MRFRKLLLIPSPDSNNNNAVELHMKQLTLFRILTFILIPIAAIFGFIDLLLLVIALANPILLFGVFILGCFVIYTFASLKFLSKGIDRNAPCKPSLRDWIRVNAFVSIFISFQFLWEAVRFFRSSDAELRTRLSQQIQAMPYAPPAVNISLYIEMMKALTYFTVFMSIVLVVHIVMNFRLLKQYQYLFEERTAQ